MKFLRIILGIGLLLAGFSSFGFESDAGRPNRGDEFRESSGADFSLRSLCAHQESQLSHSRLGLIREVVEAEEEEDDSRASLSSLFVEFAQRFSGQANASIRYSQSKSSLKLYVLHHCWRHFLA